ncbi:hypothetical protein D1007_55452 [Hordeum vulgare]|nr:hypothetical protein D1007_55452 [Hordeum vulgare]
MNAIVSIITIVSLTDKCIKEREVDVLLNNEKAPKCAYTVAASQSAESPFPSSDGDSAQLDSSVPSLAEAAKPGFRKAEKHSKNALRSVSELHIGNEKLAGSNKFDMDKVLKGFGAPRASGASSGTNIQVGDVPLKSSEMCPSKITIPGKKAPLDLTLKTTLQFVSSSSVKCGNCLEKQSCNAYLSQSTRGMRSILRKQGVCFSMPLCKAKVEEATEDDLLEFSKIRTLDLGQTLHVDALSEVDNTTQSLLSFTGNKSVHGLYEGPYTLPRIFGSGSNGDFIRHLASEKNQNS